MSTKLVPEAPANTHLVEPVYKARKHAAVINTQTLVRELADMDSSNLELGPRTNKKVKKYRDKFDPRVTAKYDIKALIGRGSFSRVVRYASCYEMYSLLNVIFT